uniref:Uncharacterized protein n=1 Tax=Anguilla anguilla TaxID=7936 RepID=A0A0E9S727_ANGAN
MASIVGMKGLFLSLRWYVMLLFYVIMHTFQL